MSEVKLTSLDNNQISRYTYDDDNRAQRVVLVGGEMPQMTINQTPPSSQEVQIVKVEVPIIVREIELKVIEVPIITVQKDIQIVEVPLIVKEIEYREIEKPVYITEIQKVEVPVMVKEIQLIYVDKLNMKMFYIAQGITLVLILLSKFLK